MKKVIYILIVIILFSCSSSHKININKDNSAEIVFAVSNKESLVNTLNEWSSIQGDAYIIDTKKISDGFSSDPNISETEVKSSTNNNYTGSFYINDINNLFKVKDSESNSIFTITENNGIKTLDILISLDNYNDLKRSVPILQDESIDMLGPEANQDISEEDYLDMISFSLGDQGPKELTSSNVELEITVDGTILDINGGTIVDESKATFKLPLIKLILLKDEIKYQLSYK